MQRVKRGLDKHSAGGVADEADGVGRSGIGLTWRRGDAEGSEVARVS